MKIELDGINTIKKETSMQVHKSLRQVRFIIVLKNVGECTAKDEKGKMSDRRLNLNFITDAEIKSA